MKIRRLNQILELNKDSKIAIISPQITTALVSQKYYSSQQINMAKKIISNNKKVTIDIITAKGPDNPNQKDIFLSPTSKFKIIYLSYLKLPFQQYILFNLKMVLKINKYSHIISSEDNSLNTLFISLIKNKKSKLFIYQGPYSYSKKIYFRLLWKFFDFIVSPILKLKTYKVIAKTPESIKFMRKKGYKNIELYPPPINEDIFYPRDKNRFKNKIGIKNKKLYLFVGVLNKNKRLDLVVKYFHKKFLNNKNSLLCVIGNGPEKNNLMKLIKSYKLKDNFVYFEKIKNKKLPFIYSAADELINMSDYEIYGMTIAEAKACGCKIVCREIPIKKMLNL